MVQSKLGLDSRLNPFKTKT